MGSPPPQVSHHDPIARAQRVGAGPQAPGTALLRHLNFLRRLCRGLRRTCASDADDLAQDVVVRILEHARTAGAPRDIRGWIVRTARNLAADAARRELLRAAQDEELRSTLDDQASADEFRPDRIAESREWETTLSHVLRRAPPSELAVARSRARGQPLRLIAANLGLSIATAWRLESRLRARLSRALGIESSVCADDLRSDSSSSGNS